MTVISIFTYNIFGSETKCAVFLHWGREFFVQSDVLIVKNRPILARTSRRAVALVSSVHISRNKVLIAIHMDYTYIVYDSSLFSYKIVLTQSFCALARFVGSTGTLLVLIDRMMGPILSMRIHKRLDISCAVSSGTKLSKVVDRNAVRCMDFPGGANERLEQPEFSKDNEKIEPQQRIG